MKSAVLDPKLLLYPGCDGAGEVKVEEYLDTISDWLTGRYQVGLAPAGYKYVLDQFTLRGYPEHALPIPGGSRGRLAARLVGSLLIASLGNGDPESAEIEAPDYLGDAGVSAVVASDVAHAVNNSAIGFASRESHWSEPSRFVSIVNGEAVELLFDPTQESQAHAAERLASLFASRRVYIVGGKRHQPFLDRLESHGIRPEIIDWIEVERDISPAIVKKRLSGVNGAKCIVACWTGRIGHSGSEAAKKKAASGGARYIFGESLEDLRSALIDCVT